MRYINKLDDKDYVTKLSGNNLLLILWERQDLREDWTIQISVSLALIESENINEKLNNEVKQLSEERISISKSQRRSCVGETYRKRMAHQGCIYSRVKESLSYKNPLLPPILVLVIKKRLWQKRLSMNYKALSLSSYI